MRAVEDSMQIIEHALKRRPVAHRPQPAFFVEVADDVWRASILFYPITAGHRVKVRATSRDIDGALDLLADRIIARHYEHIGATT